jgi:hypothetical protein
VEIGEGLGESFVVLDEPAEAGGPGKRAFANPALGQQHEATLDVGKLDDAQFDAMLLRGLGGFFAGVALIDEGDFDAVASFRLNGLGDAADFGAIIGVGGVMCSASRWLRVSTANAVSIPSCAWCRRRRRERRSRALSAACG